MWKYWVGFWVLVLGGVLMFTASCLIDKLNSGMFAILMMGGTLIALSGFLWQILSIKCPKCGAKLFWMAVAKQKKANYSVWFFGLEKCPVCEKDSQDEKNI